MKLAAMQPYFFPYLGYYQLAAGVDRFVFLDDAAFITRGFIHRNRILLDGRPYRFTLPVEQASQHRSIAAHRFAAGFARFLQQLRHGYARAPHFADVLRLVESAWETGGGNVAAVCAASVESVFAYLGLALPTACASTLDVPGRGQERILALCRHFGAVRYLNAPGGRALYDADAFAAAGLRLCFVQPVLPAYRQPGAAAFVPGLSMIDVLMNTAPDTARAMLSQARVEEAA